jgi:hypothetical protein
LAEKGAAGAGTGDVIGPSGATNNAVVLFDGTTGKLIKDGGVLGTAAFSATSAFATAAQGSLADSALQSAAIGTTIQAYDSNLTSFVSTFTLPITDGTNGQVLQTNGSGTLSFTTPTGGSELPAGAFDYGSVTVAADINVNYGSL